MLVWPVADSTIPVVVWTSGCLSDILFWLSGLLCSYFTVLHTPHPHPRPHLKQGKPVHLLQYFPTPPPTWRGDEGGIICGRVKISYEPGRGGGRRQERVSSGGGGDRTRLLGPGESLRIPCLYKKRRASTTWPFHSL